MAVTLSTIQPSNPSLRIENAIPSDVEAIVRVVCDAFDRDKTFVNTEVYPRVRKAEIQESFNNPLHHFFLLVDEIRTIVGVILYMSDSPSEASMHLLSVRPQDQQKGYAQHLLQACEEKALREGKSTLSAEVTSLKNRLIAKSDQFGFKSTGKKVEFFQKVLREEWQGLDEHGQFKVQTEIIRKTLSISSVLTWKVAKELGYTGSDFEVAATLFNQQRSLLFSIAVQLHKAGKVFEEFGKGET